MPEKEPWVFTSGFLYASVCMHFLIQYIHVYSSWHDPLLREYKHLVLMQYAVIHIGLLESSCEHYNESFVP